MNAFLEVFRKVFKNFLVILHDLLKNFLLLKIYEKILREILLKCKKKKKKKFMNIFWSLSWHPLLLIRTRLNRLILTRSYEKENYDYVTIPQGFRQFWQNLSFDFEKKLLLSEVIVSVNRRRKDSKVALVSFGLHSGRFTLECKEYGNKLFSYFNIFIQVLSNLLKIQWLKSICSDA